jgi:DMSO/TMAO reductase YedYZ molybdopterin-dependent catalytic subunit
MTLKVLTKEPMNCESSFTNLESDLTGEDLFYVRSHFAVPKIDLATWRLQIKLDGEVLKSISYTDLSVMRQHSLNAILECAGNGRKNFGRQVEGEIDWGDCAVGNASWRGVLIPDLIKAVHPDVRDFSKVKELLFIGADGSQETSTPLESKMRYVRALPKEKAMDGDTIVALSMNGRPLSKEHGFPARTIVPGWYAMASVKWLNRIVLSTQKSDFQGHFNRVKYIYVTEKNGRSINEPVVQLRVKSLITRPEEGDTIPLEKPIMISGKAWSGFGKVVKVELDFGLGWKKAVLENNSERFGWQTWKYEWIPEKKGQTVLKVRATDETGNVQPEVGQLNKYLYGYNGIHTIHVNVD